MIIPSLVLSLAAVIAMFHPPDSGERLVVGVIVLLGLTMFQGYLNATLPPQSLTIPLITRYNVFCMGMVLVGMGVSVVVRWMWVYTGTLPSCCTTVLDKLACGPCCGVEDDSKEHGHVSNNQLATNKHTSRTSYGFS